MQTEITLITISYARHNNRKAAVSQGEPGSRDAAVNFGTYRILQ